MTEPTNTKNEFRPWNMDVNQYCMLMHLSQLAGYAVPVIGMVLPIVMWATNKDKSDLVDRTGINILNWIISSVIYVCISMFLMLFLIGFMTLLAFAICALIFIIVGALKANDGKVYKYPLAIGFIKK